MSYFMLKSYFVMLNGLLSLSLVLDDDSSWQLCECECEYETFIDVHENTSNELNMLVPRE